MRTFLRQHMRSYPASSPASSFSMISCTRGPCNGLHSVLQIIFPDNVSVSPAFVVSNDITRMCPSSGPTFLPAALIASIAPNASLSFSQYTTLMLSYFQHRLHNFLSFSLCKFTGLLVKAIFSSFLLQLLPDLLYVRSERMHRWFPENWMLAIFLLTFLLLQHMPSAMRLLSVPQLEV